MKGHCFIFEGCDCCGKDTQLDLAEKDLIKKGYKVKKLFSPGSGPNGMKLRELLLNKDNKILPLEETLLYCAANIEALNEIQNAVNDGYIVLMNRLMMSTIAYQSANLCMNNWGINDALDFVIDMCNKIDTLKADDTDYIIYRISPETALTRIKQKNRDRIESRPDSYFEAVCKLYNEFFITMDCTFYIDGENTIEKIHENTMNFILNKLKC